MMFAVGTLLVSSLALMAPWLQILADYPVETAGLVMAPRGFGNLLHDHAERPAVAPHRSRACWSAIGLLMDCCSFWMMTGWTPDVSQHELIIAIIIQGAGLGLVFTPLQMLAFATLAPALRTEGAVAVQPVPQHRRGDRRFGRHHDAGAQHPGAARDDRRLGHPVQPRAGGAGHAGPRASRTARRCWTRWSTSRRRSSPTCDDYVLLIFTTLPALLLLLLMRRPRQVGPVRAEAME